MRNDGGEGFVGPDPLPEDIAMIAPEPDLFVADMRECAAKVVAHEHPARGEDLYCLNLMAYMGERMGGVLRRLDESREEVASLKARNTALADEMLAEVTALRELGRAALRESEAEVTALRAELDAAKANECTALCGDVEQERDELRAELDAALEDAKQAWFYLARSAEGIARQIERAAVAGTPEWKQAGEAAIYVDAAAWAAAIARRHGAEGATDEQTT